MKTLKQQLALHKKALAQSRENYSALLADYRELERRHARQVTTIYRMQCLAKRLADSGNFTR